jgi:hypothetical protein
MDAVEHGKQDDPIEETSRSENESENVSTSNAQIQERTKQTADTSLGSRVAKVLSKCKEIKGIALASLGSRVAKVLSMCKEIMGIALAKIYEVSVGGKPSDDLMKVAANFIATIDDGGIQESFKLAVDVLTHPEKNRNFEEISDGDGPKFGKKDTVHKIKAGLEKLDEMSGTGVDNAREVLTAAKKIVQLKLKIAMVEKAVGYATKITSIVIGIVGVVGSYGASLVPTIIKFVTSSLDSINGIVQTTIEETHAKAMQQTGGIFDGNKTQFEALDQDARLYLGQCHGLAVDVLTHPEKSKGFKGPRGAKFGKKETKQFLGAALSKFDEQIKGVTDPNAQEGLAKVKQDIQTAHDIVSSKLNRARVIKGLKISGAIFATIASIAACVATFGIAAPAIPAAIIVVIGALGAAVRDGKLVYELWENRHKH